MAVLRGLVILSGADPDAWPGTPFALAPVANRPVVEHVIASMGAAGAVEMTIAAPARLARAVREAVGAGVSARARVRHLELEDGGSAWDGLRTSPGDMALAIAGGALVVEPLEPLLARAREERLDALVAPGLQILSARAVSVASQARARSSAEVERACRAADLSVSTVRGPLWSPELGGTDGFIEANRIALDAEPEGHAHVPPGCTVRGRVRIHPTASIERSTICGPAVIGAGAHVSHAYVGPYTSVGDGVRLEAAEVEDSVLMAGARIEYLGSRLRSSVVGAGARVRRGTSLPHGLIVRLGAGADVLLG